MPKVVIPFSGLKQDLIATAGSGECASIVGLSNSGKSIVMRSLASPQARELYGEHTGRAGMLIYVDCNRAVSISAQAFYEVILRSLLEELSKLKDHRLLEEIRRYHQVVTEAENAFEASLSFNLALSDLCERLGQDLCLLLDEFDEIYAALDERTLLNLRALRDRFADRLVFITATIRKLPEIRNVQVEDEFAELFSRFTFHMPLLDADESKALLKELKLPRLTKELTQAAIQLSGGHPGLLVAVAQIFASSPAGGTGDPREWVRTEPLPRAECLKLWNQMTPDEHAALITLALEQEAGIPSQQLRHLQDLGVVHERELFSPIFAEFVRRKGRAPDTETRGVFLDADSGDVWVDGIRVPVLTDLEYRLLELLHERRDKLTDKFQIVTAVWGEEYLGDVDDARVEKLISRLRAKIEPDPSNPRYLITRRGRGYKLLSHPKVE